MMQPISTVAQARLDSSLDLLLKAQSGNDEALDQLLARYLPRLRRWASGRLPWALRTMLDTEDLVQDAVIKALPHLKTLEIRSQSALKFYLQQALKNRIVDLHKRARCRPEREGEIPEFVQADGPSPQHAAIVAEEIERYERALGSLRSTEQQAIMLRIEFGYTYGEIAKELRKRSSDAARMAVSRALVRLADKMGRADQSVPVRGAKGPRRQGPTVAARRSQTAKGPQSSIGDGI
jgi:RNA polymerase sigma factor (sigma-70 family)